MPQILLIDARSALIASSTPAGGILPHEISRVPAADARRLHPPVRREIGADRGDPCMRGDAAAISSTLAAPRAVRRIAWTRIGRLSPPAPFG